MEEDLGAQIMKVTKVKLPDWFGTPCDKCSDPECKVVIFRTIVPARNCGFQDTLMHKCQLPPTEEADEVF